MRHIYYAIIFITAGLSSCSTEEDTKVDAKEKEPPKEISYTVQRWDDVKQTLDVGSTRSHLIRYYDDMTAEQIAVTAIMPDNDLRAYINKETLSYQNDEWNTPSRYYWPLQTLNFFALLPMTDGNRGEVTYTAEATSFQYTSPRDNASQTDLMYACTYNQTKAANSVPLYFQHPLASISFKAKTENTTVSVDVSGIEIHNVGTSATYTFPTITTADPTTLAQEGGSGIDEADLKGRWTGLSSQSDVLEAGITETTLSSVGEAQELTSNGGELFIIPQALPSAWNPGDDDNPNDPRSQTGCYLVVRCRLASNGLYLAGSPTTWGEVYVPFTGTYEQGQHYTYTLTFGLGYNALGARNKIMVTTTSTITDWERETINFDPVIL